MRWPSDAHAWVIRSRSPDLAPGRPDPVRANSFILNGVNEKPYTMGGGAPRSSGVAPPILRRGRVNVEGG